MNNNSECNKENADACFVCTAILGSESSFSFAPIATPAECTKCSCASAAVNETMSDNSGHDVNKKDSVQFRGILKRPCEAHGNRRTATDKPKVTFEPLPRMKRSTDPSGPVSAESIGGSSGGKQLVVNPIRKHNTVAQAYAIASASRKRLELINEGIIPREEPKHLNWPIVWLKPKTGSNTEAHIHTQKPKALVFDPSRADGSYQTMSIKQALSKFAG